MDSHLLHLFVLAVVQGIAEFLPISSDGHLLLANEIWQRAGGGRLTDMLETEIVLHAGTLVSILVVYRQRIGRLLADDRQMIGKLIVGTLPAVVVGLPLHEIDACRSWLEKPLLGSCLLPVTGLLVLLASRRAEGTVEYGQISYTQALVIGAAQAVAILPGISRSGMTIAAGLMLGLRREAAASFSFMLAIPVIGGAVVLGTKGFLQSPFTAAEAGSLLAAAAVSFVVGVAALGLLLRWLREGRLWPLAWWCIVVGVASAAWQVAGEPWYQ
ncbi:MAG TPA: undecaprenyl-diphosphate phosphatase [Pirellulales bacterium]|nr:undecaprenyl-diphosphate phosphatase [Pirellulales bacterium]